MKRLAEIAIPEDETPDKRQYYRQQKFKFQWISTDFSIHSTNKVKFLSYVNNLHPDPNSPSGKFYPVLEGLLSRFVPLFEAVLSRSPLDPMLDHEPYCYGFDPPKPGWDEKDDEGNWKTDTWKNSAVTFIRPRIRDFQPPNSSNFKLGGKTCQVVVKLASVELTPEKPEFEGGVSHVEGEFDDRQTNGSKASNYPNNLYASNPGTSNEKICATGI